MAVAVGFKVKVKDRTMRNETSYRRLTSIYEDAKEKLWKGQQIDTWDKNKHI